MINKQLIFLILPLILALTLTSCEESEKDIYKRCRNFLDEVYETMDTHYYKKMDREAFDVFVEKFNTDIYPRLRQEGKSPNYVQWRSASYMIQELKSSEDVFSEFYPPKPAQKFEAKALGKVTGPRRPLGIKGEVVERGYKVVHVEPRADAYAQGLRVGDIVLAVGESFLKGLDEEGVQDLLTPDADLTVPLTFLGGQDGQEKKIDVVAKEFFKQQLFMEPVQIPGIYCLRMEHFNRKTFEDMFRYLKFFRKHGPILGLIIDLRGNPGGPPLAALQIASFFLPGGEEFTSFKRKGKNVSSLDVPTIAEEFRYHGPMVVLINKDSGSSSELFSGVLQKRNRAFVLGTNSAGQVMLKSMFNFKDGSMALLITARGHHPDGSVFSFEGITPDKIVNENEDVDLVDYAAKFLYHIRLKMEKLMK